MIHDDEEEDDGMGDDGNYAGGKSFCVACSFCWTLPPMSARTIGSLLFL